LLAFIALGNVALIYFKRYRFVRFRGSKVEAIAVATLALLAALVGMVAAMTGVGGGFLIVPVLNLAFGLPVHQAVGTSLVTIIFTALFSTFAYAKQKRIDYKLGLIFTIGTVPGAILGAYTTKLLTERVLAAVFGVSLILIASRMIGVWKISSIRSLKAATGWRRRLVDSKGMIFEYSANMKPGISLSFLGGFASGLLGIGGGVVMVPVLNLAVGFPIHLAVAASMFIMIFTSISGAMTHIALGNVQLEYAAYLILGVIAGTQLGAAVASRLKEKALTRIFGFVIILIGLRMITSYFLP